MKKSVIVYDAPDDLSVNEVGRIRRQLGLSEAFRNFNYGSFLGYNAMYITSREKSVMWESRGIQFKPFNEIAAEINAAIPLTDWQEGPPPAIGEWDVKFTKTGNFCRRWWHDDVNGGHWSCGWTSKEKQNKANKIASIPAVMLKDWLLWRGLSKKPIPLNQD